MDKKAAPAMGAIKKMLKKTEGTIDGCRMQQHALRGRRKGGFGEPGGPS